MVNLNQGLAQQSPVDNRSGNDIPSGRNFYINGSGMITGALSLVGALSTAAQTITAGGESVTGSIVVSSNGVWTAGSPYNVGWVTVPITARSIISGGAWVGGSGGLAYQLGASPKAPLGVAAATAQSGATVNVIIRGIVPMTADGTVATIGGVMPGAGAAGNTVSPHVAGSSLQYPTLADAGSAATVFVVL